MQVILTEDVKNVGTMGQVVEVAAGYGRNYLIPQKMAMLATASNKKALAHQLTQIEARREREREAARGILGTIDGVSVTIPMRVGEQDKLFGSVTNRDIVTSLGQQGVQVDRRQVDLDAPINELGIYKVAIKLASGIYAHVNVWIVAM